MCLAIPGRVVSLEDEHRHLATVDVEGVRRRVNVGLLDGEELAAGDWVLIHVGFALSRIDEAEAERTLALLRGLGSGELAQELADFEGSDVV